MKDIRTKNLFTRLIACIMIFAMCIGFVTVPAFADAVEDYEYTVNYTMTDPVLKGNGAKLYWSDMTEGGYEFADEGEEGYGKKLRLTNSNATLGVSGASGDIYSISFDMKFTAKDGASTEDHTYFRMFTSNSKPIGLVRVTSNNIQLGIKKGEWFDNRDTSATSVCKVIPYNNGEWVNIEFVVNSSTLKTEWYVNGVKKATGTAYEGGIAWANVVCAGTKTNYTVEFDNVKTSNVKPKVTVLPVSIGVTAGTSYDEALKKLPNYVAGQKKDGSYVQLPVTWESGEYDSSNVGTTQIKGVLNTDLVYNTTVYATVNVFDALPDNLKGKTKLTQFIPHKTALSMGYLIETKTGKFIGIDGGVLWAETPEAEQDDDFLFKYLQKVTGEDKPVIDAWFLTHAHADHVNSFTYMLNNHKDDITIKNIYLNIPYDGMPDGYIENVSADVYNSLSDALEAYTGKSLENYDFVNQGDMYVFDDVTFDVLMVPNGEETNGNAASIILKMRADGQDTIFLGDLDDVMGERLADLYGEKLKSDIVQMAHHGQGGVGKEVYQLIQPKLCLWPAANWVYNDKYTSTYSYITKEWMEELGVENHIIAGIDGTTTIELPYEEPVIETVDQYTLVNEMTEPVLQASGVPVYWSQVSNENGYAFVDENELGYGKKLRLTNSDITLGGLSAGNADIYSISFDMKFTGTASEDNTVEMYLRNWDTSNVNLGFMRVTDSVLQLSTVGQWVAYKEIDDTDCVTAPYTKGEWNRIEYIVNKTYGTIEWFVNGIKIGTGKTKANWNIAFANIACLGTDKNYTVEFDNVKISSITKATVEKDETLLLGYNNFDGSSSGMGYADGTVTTVTENSPHNKVVKIDNKEDGNANISIYPNSAGTTITKLVGLNSWVLSYDIKVNDNKAGFISYLKMAGRTIVPIVFFKNGADATTGVVGVSKNAYTVNDSRKAEITGTAPTASNSSYNIAEYNLGEWLSIDIVINGTTSYTYINGKFVGATTSNGVGTINETSWKNGVYLFSPDTANTIDAYVDNLKITNPVQGAFFYTAKADNGKIVLDFTQGISDIYANGIKLYDKYGDEVAKIVELSGHNVVITPAKACGYYKIEMPEHTMGAAGNLLAERTAEVTAPIFEVVSAEIVERGNVATLNVSYENSVATGKTLYAFIAAYEGHVLKAIDIQEHTVAGSLTEIYTPANKPSITVPETADAVKGFVWMKDSLTPVIPPVVR